jgi:hypothetical protein
MVGEVELDVVLCTDEIQHQKLNAIVFELLA